MSTAPNPLRPPRTVVNGLSWILGISLIVFLTEVLDDFGWPPGSSQLSPCVDIDNWLSTSVSVPPLPVSQGVHAYAGLKDLCTDTPSMAQQIAFFGNHLPMAAFVAGGLFLLLRFLRTATKEGPYGTTVPSRLGVLGWFLIAVGPACALVSSWATFALRNSMIAGIPGWPWWNDWLDRIPWLAIILGVAALTFARVLRIGVGMHEDREETV